VITPGGKDIHRVRHKDTIRISDLHRIQHQQLKEKKTRENNGIKEK